MTGAPWLPSDRDSGHIRRWLVSVYIGAQLPSLKSEKWKYTKVQVARIVPATRPTKRVFIPNDEGHKFQPGYQTVICASPPESYFWSFLQVNIIRAKWQRLQVQKKLNAVIYHCVPFLVDLTLKQWLAPQYDLPGQLVFKTKTEANIQPMRNF